tara:strand:+ start:1501 stop:1644 length:144 start_codon:yes stop_codon:yes gene_type:complete
MKNLINKTWLITPDTPEERAWKISYRNTYMPFLNENGIREKKRSINV